LIGPPKAGRRSAHARCGDMQIVNPDKYLMPQLSAKVDFPKN
jgi:hypothetical protein